MLPTLTSHWLVRETWPNSKECPAKGSVWLFLETKDSASLFEQGSTHAQEHDELALFSLGSRWSERSADNTQREGRLQQDTQPSGAASGGRGTSSRGFRENLSSICEPKGSGNRQQPRHLHSRQCAGEGMFETPVCSAFMECRTVHERISGFAERNFQPVVCLPLANNSWASIEYCSNVWVSHVHLSFAPG